MPKIPSMDDFYKHEAFVGRFVGQFSNLEFNIRRLIVVQSGVSPEIIKILIGFPRTGEAITKLKQLCSLRLSDSKAQSEVEAAFQQLAAITLIRDRLVHYGGHPIGTGEILVRTKPGLKSKTTGEGYDLFSHRTLFDASIDLQQIEYTLLVHLDMTMPDDMRNDMRLNVGKPWRYKSP